MRLVLLLCFCVLNISVVNADTAPLSELKSDTHSLKESAAISSDPVDAKSKSLNGMDHGGMDHGDMDHGDMDHGDMDQGSMDHGSMDHGSMDHENGLQNEAAEATKKFSHEEALKISQSALGKTIGHYNFLATDGSKVNTQQFLGKPVIVSLIYTSCYHICPTITENLNRVVQKARDVFGKDSFNVLTIGFDTDRDTPQAMAEFKKAHSSGADNWYFLSSDKVSMQALSRDLGFIYIPSTAGYDHLIQATILDKQGEVYRQVYGLKPDTPHFVEPIKELVYGEPAADSLFADFTAKVKLFCTVYDPAQDRYYFNYSFFVGVIVCFIMGSFFITILYREWCHSSKTTH